MNLLETRQYNYVYLRIILQRICIRFKPFRQRDVKKRIKKFLEEKR